MFGKLHARSSLMLLSRWTIATSLGWLAGIVLAGLFVPIASRIPLPIRYDSDMAFSYAILVFVGLTVGVSQWFILRSYQVPSANWIALTVTGYLLCLIILMIANRLPISLLSTNILNNSVLLGSMGIAIGIAQWLMLRRYFRHSWIWIFASAIGFLFFLWLVLDPSSAMTEFAFRVTLIGAAGAVVSGGTLIWVSRMPIT